MIQYLRIASQEIRKARRVSRMLKYIEKHREIAKEFNIDVKVFMKGEEIK